MNPKFPPDVNFLTRRPPACTRPALRIILSRMTTRTISAIVIMIALALLAAPGILNAADAPAPANQGKKMLYHVVAIKFKPEAKPEQIKAVETAFAELKIKIPGVTSLNWGTNVSPEQKNKGFTHCFVLTFATEKDRDAYLQHPEHQAFGKLLGPIVGDVLVIDFWSQE
jgi:hypothetical protein